MLRFGVVYYLALPEAMWAAKQNKLFYRRSADKGMLGDLITSWMLATEGMLIIKTLISRVRLVQALIYSHTPLLNRWVERYNSRGPTVYSLIRHHACSPSNLQATTVSVGIWSTHWSDTLKFCLISKAFPNTKIKFIFWREMTVVNVHPAVRTDLRGDPVSHTQVHYPNI